jgi:thymidylate synthase
LQTELAALPETDLTFAAYEYFNRKRVPALLPDPRKQPKLAHSWRVFIGQASPVEEDISEHLRTAISSLHAEKSAVYGNSWKRRGEVLGIGANIARKVDRLERALTMDVSMDDESLLDTAIDLLVYATKYMTFLADEDEKVALRLFGEYGHSTFSEGVVSFDVLLSRLDFRSSLNSKTSLSDAIREVVKTFAAIEVGFNANVIERADRAQRLADAALRTVGAVMRAIPASTYSAFLARTNAVNIGT